MLCHKLWRRGVVVITNAQLHSTKPELTFFTGSNPTCGMSEIRDGEVHHHHSSSSRINVLYIIWIMYLIKLWLSRWFGFFRWWFGYICFPKNFSFWFDCISRTVTVSGFNQCTLGYWFNTNILVFVWYFHIYCLG